MTNIAALFDRAVRHHQRGELDQAELLYREILQAEPRHAESLHLLGYLKHQVGDSDAAISLIRHAIALIPGAAIFHSNLGIVLMDVGLLEEAVDSFGQAVRLKPGFADAYSNLALALKKQDKLVEAAECCRQALAIDPNHVNALNIRGNVLLDLKKPAEAVASYREALRIDPQFVDALSNLGLALLGTGQAAEAVVCCRQALRINPRHAISHNNMALAHLREARLAEAAAGFEEALELKPDYPSARWNLALLKLLHGDWTGAWAGFELRWRLAGFIRSHTDKPLWDGAPLHGKTILLYAEQGLGDTIQFIRFAPLVKERGGFVLVECQPALLRVLQGVSGVDRLLPLGQPLPHFDTHAPLMSLAGIFDTSLATLPAQVPYLRSEPELVERWRAELSAINGFKVGIVWQGSPTQEDDQYRSIPLALYAPLAAVPGVRLLSLQVGHGKEQLPHVPFPVYDIGSRFDPVSLHDLAAVLPTLDLIVTVCTSVAHLAGALGVPAWVALRRVPHWVWQLDRPNTPWYPSLRLFRQERRDEWASVLTKMAAALREHIGQAQSAPTAGPVMVETAAGELIDKITILEIKSERIADAYKLRNIRAELATLRQARDQNFPESPQLRDLTAALKNVNEALWEIEDDIREQERSKDFGSTFIELARSVYLQNDRRAELKRSLNDLLGSRLVEEKSYAKYS